MSDFNEARVTRMVCLGFPYDDILPLFKPLISSIIRRTAWDSRNHSDDDLMQIGLLKTVEVIDKFKVSEGSLTGFATTLIQHAIWSEARVRPLDRLRESDEVEFDTIRAPRQHDRQLDCELDEETIKKFRLEEPVHRQAAEYVFGVLSSNDYEQNRARVLKTLTYGYDINPKHARFLADQVLVILRQKYSRGPSEVRDDALFSNKFKFSLIPELRELLGERAFERIIHFFGGMTISIPSMSHINNIDRDLAILKALALDWTSGPSLSKKFSISPEGVKAVYKSCLHALHTDQEYRDLVSKIIPLDRIPGYEGGSSSKKPKKPVIMFGEARPHPRRKISNTDSMGFTLGCRNSLLYTLIVTGKCTRVDLVKVIVEKFGGTESAAKATVSAFLSDIKLPFGRFNTSRNLTLLVDGQGRLSFEKKSLEAAQKIVAVKRQAQLIASTA